jgi:hypothetical protein
MLTLPLMCSVKLFGDGIHKIRGMNRDGSNQVRSWNLKMSFTLMHLSIIKR